ncbi:MAG TPA: HDOD domain-containing protein [Lacunisphaera sp.]|nr:HDOD domain-containing protein [Lacunisphaera sp.]
MSLDRDTIITLGSKLPPALGIFGRLRTLLDDADCDLDEIVELLRVDPALTFQIIKLSNSALYGLKSRTQTLDEAVARVGFGEIHQLVGLIVSRQVFQGDLKLYGIPAGRLWENAVAVGALATAFASRSGANSGSAYSGGLLRNLGKIILNNLTAAVAYPGEEAQPDVFAWEKAQHDITSPEATAMLLDHWRFPFDITGAVCTHLNPDTAGEFAAGASTLHLACSFAAEWGCALPGEGPALWRRDDALLAMVGVEKDLIEGAVADARQQFSRFAMIEWSQAA